jgi:hypothetical protein
MLREADPDFLRALQLMREVQIAGGVGMRIEELKDDDKVKGSIAVLFFQRDDLAPEIREKGDEARRLLRLPVDQQRFVLAYSPIRRCAGRATY